MRRWFNLPRPAQKRSSSITPANAVVVTAFVSTAILLFVAGVGARRFSPLILIPVLLLLAAVIFLRYQLMTERRGRIEADEKNAARTQVDGLVTEISTSLNTLAYTELDPTITIAIESVGEIEEVHRVTVRSFDSESALCTLAYRWDEVTPVGTEEEGGEFSTLRQIIESGKIVAGPVGTLPSEAVAERRYFARSGTRSLLAVPFYLTKRVGGFVMLESRSPDRSWSDDTVHLVTGVAQVIASAIVRKRTETAFTMDSERFSELTNSLRLIFFLTDPGLEEVFYVSRPPSEIIFGAGDTSETVLELLTTAVAPREYRRLQHLLRQAVETASGVDVEYPVISGYTDQWIRLHFYPIRDETGAIFRYAGVIEDIHERKMAELSLENQRQKDEEMSGMVQRALLFGEPDTGVARLDLRVATVPSKAVDGDFYDFFPHSSRLLDIVVGDVMGKGFIAALTGAAAKSIFLKSLLTGFSENEGLDSLSEVLGRVSAHLSPKLMRINRFITLQAARLDTDEPAVEFVDCGHTPIIHYDQTTQEVWFLKGVNMPLGFMDEQRFRSFRVPLFPGDRLVFFSDGITEAAAPDGTLYGATRLAQYVSEMGSEPAAELVHGIIREARTYAEGKFTDDAMCVVAAPHERSTSGILDSRRLPVQSDLTETIRKTVRATITDICDQQVSAELVIAVSEVAGNIWLHDYGGPATTTATTTTDGSDGSDVVDFLILHRNDWLYFIFTYSGSSYDPYDTPEVDLTADTTRGFGLALVRQAVDSITLCEGRDSRKRLILAKQVQRSTA